MTLSKGTALASAVLVAGGETRREDLDRDRAASSCSTSAWRSSRRNRCSPRAIRARGARGLGAGDDRNGNIKVIDDQNLFDYLGANFSSDGKRAAVTIDDRSTGLGDIWIYDLEHGGRDRFTNGPGLSHKARSARCRTSCAARWHHRHQKR